MAEQNTTAAQAAPAANTKPNFFQMRNIALDNSVAKDGKATQKALQVLREFVLNAQNGALVWRSVRVAHSAAGMTQQECIDCLMEYLEEDGKGPKKQLPDLNKDIYRQLELQEWVKYLYYRGKHKVGKDANGKDLYAKDQDLVLKYFGIKPEYTDPEKTGNHFLMCDYSRKLSPMLDLRNKFGGHSNEIREEELKLSELMGYYNELVEGLKPLVDTRWTYQSDCKTMMDGLRKALYEALGERTYQVADLMPMIPAFPNRQPEVEELLVRAGIPVNGGTVEFKGEIGEFTRALKTAWWYYRLSEASGVEQLRLWLRERDPEAAKQAAPADKAAADLKEGSAADWTELADRYRYGIKGVELDLEQAKHWYAKAANATPPDLKAMYTLGLLYERTEPLVAVGYLRNAANRGYAPAQVRMGLHSYNGTCKQPRSWREAAAWFEKAAGNNDAEGKFWLGQCYKTGRGVTKSTEQAKALYIQALHGGSDDAKASLAELNPGSSSIQTLQELEQKGFTPALAALALCYLNGRGVGKDPGLGFAYAEKAAQAGDRRGQYLLGWCYEKGRGTPADEEEAKQWYSRAAQQGHLYAQVLCADTAPQGRQWVEELAREGYAPAQLKLAKWNVYSEDSETQKAAVQLLLAEKVKDNETKLLLAECYLHARGIDQDVQKGRALAEEVAKKGTEAEQREAASLLASSYSRYSDPEKWRYWADRVAKAGDAGMAMKLTDSYFSGAENFCKDSDLDQALTYFELAAKHGDEEEAEALADFYRDGKVETCGQHWDFFFNSSGSRINPKRALYWYEIAAERGSLEACFTAGDYYLKGMDVMRDTQRGTDWYLRGLEMMKEGQGFEDWCDQNRVEEYYVTEKMLRHGMPEPVLRAAKQWLTEKAQGGSEWARVHMANYLLTGNFFPQDVAAGMNWLERAEKQDSWTAACMLASIYYKGVVVKRDLEWVFFYLHRMIYDRFIDGYWPIRLIGEYQDDAFSKQAQKKGGEWLLLGHCYANGYGTRKDQEKAFDCYSNAWYFGNEDVQQELVRRYERGIGVKRDPDMAQKVAQGEGCNQSIRENRYGCMSSRYKQVIEEFKKDLAQLQEQQDKSK